MSVNVIRKAIFVGKATIAGAEIILEVATETMLWTRHTDIARVQGEALKEALEKSKKPLPPDTTTVISREAVHESVGDKKSHITAVAYDKYGRVIRTIHIETPKED